MDGQTVDEAQVVEQNRKTMLLLASVLERKRFIVLVALLTAVCAGAVSLLVRSRYTATVEMLPPPLARPSSAASMLGSLAGGGASDLGALGSLGSAIQAKSQADTFLVILAARPIQEALVEKFDLKTVYKKSSLADARGALSEHTALKSIKEGFVYVSVTDYDRDRAAQIANGYVEQARTFMGGLSLTEASQRSIFYKTQLDKAKEDLARTETNFKLMQQNNHMISLDTQAKTLIEAAANLRSQVTAREVELQRLRSYVTESNPQLEIAKSELAALRGQLAQIESQSQKGYTSGGLSNVPENELTFVRAARDLKYQEGLYDLMVKQYESSRIDEARDAPLIQVIEPAVAPERKSGPPRALIAIGGFLVGAVLASLYVLLQAVKRSRGTSSSPEAERLKRALLSW